MLKILAIDKTRILELVNPDLRNVFASDFLETMEGMEQEIDKRVVIQNINSLLDYYGSAFRVKDAEWNSDEGSVEYTFTKEEDYE